MLPQTAPPPSQDDLLRLDRFLHSPACGRDAMGLSRAHGFLTAAASGPEQLEPAEWIRLVFDEPVFENGEQAQEMLGLAMRLYLDIERNLDEPGRFGPVLDYVRDAQGGLGVDAWPWCQGYLSGMSVCREHWAWAGSHGLNPLLAPILQLARQPGPGSSPAHRQLCDALPRAAEAAYGFWRELNLQADID